MGATGPVIHAELIIFKTIQTIAARTLPAESPPPIKEAERMMDLVYEVKESIAAS